LRALTDLKGHSIAIGAKLSMTYQIVDQALGEHGLAIGREVKFIDAASFSNVPASVLRGEAAAGATGTLLWDNAPAEQRAELREIFRSPPVPGFLLLGHPRLGTSMLTRLPAALVSFKNTPAGRDYFQQTRQLDFRPVDAKTMKRIDPYTAVFGTPLAAPR
jgi:phosphonate transport system substrate-binding protein